jgi:hypothetical protein
MARPERYVPPPEPSEAPRRRIPVPQAPVREAYRILQAGYVAGPIVAGIDKFTNVLTDWDKYLAPPIAGLLPVAPSTFMLVVGLVEVVAGLLVAVKPSVAAWLVAAWLWGIVLNLLMIPGYLDIALRDVLLSLGAVALARLGVLFERDALTR